MHISHVRRWKSPLSVDSTVRRRGVMLIALVLIRLTSAPLHSCIRGLQHMITAQIFNPIHPSSVPSCSQFTDYDTVLYNSLLPRRSYGQIGLVCIRVDVFFRIDFSPSNLPMSLELLSISALLQWLRRRCQFTRLRAVSGKRASGRIQLE